MNIKQAIINYSPSTIKRIIKKITYKIAYPKTTISTDTIIIPNTKKVKIGKNTKICYNVEIEAFAGVTIGKNCLIASGTRIITTTHDYHYYPITKAPLKYGKVTIKNGVWIGADSIILPAITIEKNSIIGAGSIVTKNIPANQIWAGNPAHYIKKREKLKNNKQHTIKRGQ